MTELDITKDPIAEPPDDAVIDEVLKAHPNELLFVPPSYRRLDRDTDGSWRVVRDGTDPVAVVWTDWQDGAGVLPIKDSELAAKLLRYFVVNKMMNAPAGIAFTSSQHVEGASFDEVEDGPLVGAMQDASSLAKGKR